MFTPLRVKCLVVLLSLAGHACNEGDGFREPGLQGDARTPSYRPEDGGLADGASAEAGGIRADLRRAAPRPPFARNVILFVGDGMGFPQVEAARRFANGNTQPLAMETLPTRGRMFTRNASSAVTDSAAGATAFATGVKVKNEVLSLHLPGTGAPLRTALELRKEIGAATGLVTRETPILDATPAAFFAHQASRYAYAAIARDLFDIARPDFLAGEAVADADNIVAAAAGYRTITDAWDPLATAGLMPGAAKMAWFYKRTPPELSEVTNAAIAFLSRSPVGFFLMVENEGTDTGGHAHDLQHVIASVLQLDRAVAAAIAWQAGRNDTLIVVTADHETGALSLADEPAAAGVLPGHTFGDSWHTAAPVPLFCGGVGAAALPAAIENTDLFRWLAP